MLDKMHYILNNIIIHHIQCIGLLLALLKGTYILDIFTSSKWVSQYLIVIFDLKHNIWAILCHGWRYFHAITNIMILHLQSQSYSSSKHVTSNSIYLKQFLRTKVDVPILTLNKRIQFVLKTKLKLNLWNFYLV
jgi:hypothetical protein